MLDNAVCIVCGGGRGIGAATAKKMAEQGATVVVNDLGVDLEGGNETSEPVEAVVDDIVDAGGQAVPDFGDITDVRYTESLIRETAAEFGAVHCVANFAGILRDNMLYNMSEDEWDAVIDVHLKGHYSLLHNAAAHWRERYKDEEFDRQRSFICVSSGAARGTVGQANYSAAKAGVLGLMRSAARELSRYNVRVNAFWPLGYTRMIERMPEQYRERYDEDEHDPMAVATLPTYLASEDATDVTGCTLELHASELAFVSNPTEERVMIRDVVETGGWTLEEIGAQWEKLTKGFETDNG